MKKGMIILILSIAMAAGHTSYANPLTPLFIARAAAYCDEKDTVSGWPTRKETELIRGYATAYPSENDTCYRGDKIHEGICGGCKEYYGKTIILYQRLPNDKIGEIIGIYECLDWGPGTKGFQEGRVIDVYRSSRERCQEFMDRVYEDECNGKVWIQVIEAKG